MRSRNVIVPVPAFSIVYVIRRVSSPVDLPAVRFPFIIVRDEFVDYGSCRNPAAQEKHLKYGNYFALFASHGGLKGYNPGIHCGAVGSGTFLHHFLKAGCLNLL